MALKVNVEWTEFYEYKGVIMKRPEAPKGDQKISAVTFNGGEVTGIVNGTPKGDEIFTSPYRTVGIINGKAYLLRFTPAKNANNSSVYNMTGEYNETLTEIITRYGVTGVYKASRSYVVNPSLETGYAAKYSGALLMDGYEDYGDHLSNGSAENIIAEKQVNGGWKKLTAEQAIARLGFDKSVPWEHFLVSDGNGYVLGGGSLASDNFNKYNTSAATDGGLEGVSAWDSFSSKIPDDLFSAAGMGSTGLALMAKIPDAGKEYITRSLISDEVETKLDHIVIPKEKFGSMDYDSEDYKFWGGGFVRLLMVTSAQSVHADIPWSDVYTHTSKGTQDLIISSYITGQPGSKMWNLAYKDTMEVIVSAPLGYAEMPIYEDNGMKSLSTQTAAAIQSSGLAAKVNMTLIGDLFTGSGAIRKSQEDMFNNNTVVGGSGNNIVTQGEASGEKTGDLDMAKDVLVDTAKNAAGIAGAYFRLIAALFDEAKQAFSVFTQGDQIAKGLNSMYSPVNVISSAGGNSRSNSNIGAYYWDGVVGLGWWSRTDTKGIGSSYALFGGTDRNRTNNYEFNTIYGTKEIMRNFTLDRSKGFKELFDEYTSVSYQQIPEPYLTDLNQYKFNY